MKSQCTRLDCIYLSLPTYFAKILSTEVEHFGISQKCICKIVKGEWKKLLGFLYSSLVMGPGEGLAWGLQFRNSRSPTSEEGPKPRVCPSPIFGQGPKNQRILFSKFKGLSKTKLWIHERAQAWALPKPGPGPYF